MKPRILFLVPSYACNAVTGGGQRTLLLYEALTRHNEVDTFVIDDWGGVGEDKNFDKGASQYLRIERPGQHGLAKIVDRFNPPLADTVSTALRGRRSLYEAGNISIDAMGYDLVVARYLRPAARVGIFRSGFDKPIIVDIDDRDDQVLDARLAETKNPVIRRMLTKHRDDMVTIFNELTQKAAHLWVVTQDDRASIVHPSISLLPNIAFTLPAQSPPPAGEGQTILFVGAGGHRPNVDGMTRFVEKAWPSIRAEVPEAKLRIVGSGDWERFGDRFNVDGVTVVGLVDDVAREYERSNVAICPVFEGGGSKIKVLEAFGYNRPIVTASHSGRGFVSELVNDALLTGDDEMGLASSCLHLLRHPQEAAAHAAKGRKIVEQLYSREAFFDAVTTGINLALGQPSSTSGRS